MGGEQDCKTDVCVCVFLFFSTPPRKSATLEEQAISDWLKKGRGPQTAQLLNDPQKTAPQNGSLVLRGAWGKNRSYSSQPHPSTPGWMEPGPTGCWPIVWIRRALERFHFFQGQVVGGLHYSPNEFENGHEWTPTSPIKGLSLEKG